MPVYRFEGPDGKVHRAEAGSREEAQRGLEAMWAEKARANPQGGRAPGPKGAGGLPVIGDFADAWGEGFKALISNAKRDLANPGSLTQGPRALMDLVNVPAGALTAAVTRPLSRAVANLPLQAYDPATRRKLTNAEEAKALEGDLGMSLMGLGPMRGRFAPKLSAPQPTRATRVAQQPNAAPATSSTIPPAAAGGAPMAGLNVSASASLAPPPLAALPKGDLKVARAIERALQRDQLDPAAAAAAARGTPQLPAFQAGGDNLTGLAEVLAQSPGPGQTLLRESVSNQQAGATTRVKQGVGEAFGGQGDYFTTLDAAMETRKKKALPARDRAFSTPIDEEKFASEIAPTLQRVPQSALNYAARIAKQDGFDPTEIGFEVSPASGDLPEMIAIKRPSMQALHYVKKGLDQELEGHRNALGKLDLEGNPLAASTSKVRSELGRGMRAASPDYDEFMGAWGDESGQIEALRMGRDVFSSTPEMSAERLRKRFAEMSAAEKDFYRKGVGEALIDHIRRKGGVTEARQLLKNEEFADRLRVAVPDDESFTGFMGKLEREVELANRANRVVGGSPTYGRQAARADLEEQGMDSMDALASAIDTGLSPARLTAAGLKQALKTLPRKDRSIIGDPALNEALGKALSDPDEMTRLLNLLEQKKAERFVMPSGPKIGALSAGLPPLAPKPARRAP